MSTNQTKFNYTNGTNFLLNGEPYVGYFNITDNKCYTEKYLTSTSKELKRVDNISTDYYFSNYLKDRTIDKPCTLPNTLESILIEPNELVSSNVINFKINKLQENLIYLYSRLFVGSTEAPWGETLTATLTGDEIKWVDPKEVNIYTTQLYSISSNSLQGKYTEFKKIIALKNVCYYSIFCITDTHFVALTSNLSFTNISPVIITNMIDNNSDEYCQKLEDITLSDNLLYITDSVTSQIYKYDISGFIATIQHEVTNVDPTNNFSCEADQALKNKRYLTKTIGGRGDTGYKLLSPTKIYSNGEYVIVFDKGNNCIKIFDKNLVYITKIKFRIVVNVQDIIWRKLDSKFYVLITIGQFQYIYKYNTNFILEESIQLTENIYQSIHLSLQDSNVFYLLSNENIEKRFFSNISIPFTHFNYSKFALDPYNTWNLINVVWDKFFSTWNDTHELFFKHMVVVENENNNYDTLFILNKNRIYQVFDNTLYSTVLLDENIYYFNTDQVLVKSGEYNQSFTYNRSIYKLIYNLLELKKYIRGRFLAQYNMYGNLEFLNYEYIEYNELLKLSIDIDYNSFINDNELCEANTVNRVLRQLFRFQQELLNLIEIHVVNPKTIINNNNIINID